MLKRKQLKTYITLVWSIYFWLALFLFSLFLILLVQLLLLPYGFPQWHAGNGLLVGGDWISFHNEAVVVAERIEAEGWSAWELRPKGWLPAGVASAFYALFVPHPWVLAPLNAFIHATTGLILLRILLFFTMDRKIAAVAVVPYLFFPSALIIYSQIHRDGIYILGLLLFIYGLLLLFKEEAETNAFWKFFLVVLLTAAGGTFMIWMARPYALVVFFYISLLFLFVLIGYQLLRLLGRHVNWLESAGKSALMIIIIAVLYGGAQSDGTDKYMVDIEDGSEQIVQETPSSKEAGDYQDIIETDTIILSVQWQDSTWVPSRADHLLKSIAVLRADYLIKYDHAGSSIDDEFAFNQAADFLLYLPRALQIIFLSPFPQDWLTDGRGEETTFFRRVSGLEMMIIYLLYLALLGGWWRWRKKIEFYVLFVFCMVMMLPFAYAVPNLGTIYRYRYGFLMLLVSLGMVALLSMLKERFGCELKWLNYPGRGKINER